MCLKFQNSKMAYRTISYVYGPHDTRYDLGEHEIITQTQNLRFGGYDGTKRVGLDYKGGGFHLGKHGSQRLLALLLVGSPTLHICTHHNFFICQSLFCRCRSWIHHGVDRKR